MLGVCEVPDAEMEDYYSFKVLDVIYKESGDIEVITDQLDNVDDRMYSFKEEVDNGHKQFI